MTKEMNRLRRLARSRLLDVGAVVLTFSYFYKWAVILPSCWSRFDFNHFYVSGWMLRNGHNPYTTSVEALSHALGFEYATTLAVASYPPAFLWMFAALAALPPRGAFAVWVALELISLAVVLWLTCWLLGERLSSRGRLFVVALTITSQSVLYHLLFSQAQLLLAALVLAGYAAQRAGRHGWACVVVATAGILKCYPFILLPWFVWFGNGGVRGRWRRLIGVTVFILAAIVVTGAGLWRDFFRYGLPLALEDEAGKTFHFSLPALVINIGYLRYNLHPPEEVRQWWWTASTLVGLVVLAVGYAVCLALRRDPEAQFCLLCTVMLIGTVAVQGHYFVFLVFPLTVMAVRIAAKPSLVGVIGLVLLVLAFNCLHPPGSAFFGGHRFLYLLASDLPLYGLLALAVFFCRELLGRRSFPVENTVEGRP